MKLVMIKEAGQLAYVIETDGVEIKVQPIDSNISHWIELKDVEIQYQTKTRDQAGLFLSISVSSKDRLIQGKNYYTTVYLSSSTVLPELK